MSTSQPKYGVIGHPISHSRSPVIHQAFARETGIALTYSALLAPLDGFTATVRQFRAEGGRGLNVTVPFKHEAFDYCDEHTERALQASAVNTLVFPQDPSGPVLGDNTDGVGLMRDLAYHQVATTQKRILILGSGGAARGVLGPLLSTRPALIRIANRREMSAHELVADFHNGPTHATTETTLTACALTDLLEQEEQAFDLIINATSASLSGERLPLPATLIGSHTVAYDMAYGVAPTVFMDWAAQQGAQTIDGLGMLVEQAAESFSLWHGVSPQTEPVRALLRSMLHSG